MLRVARCDLRVGLSREGIHGVGRTRSSFFDLSDIQGASPNIIPPRKILLFVSGGTGSVGDLYPTDNVRRARSLILPSLSARRVGVPCSGEKVEVTLTTAVIFGLSMLSILLTRVAGTAYLAVT